MLLGFISLLLTAGQSLISNICVPKSVGNSWHPCGKGRESSSSSDSPGRKLRQLSYDAGSLRRVLAGGGGDSDKSTQGKVALISSDGIHQLHIFIFVLAVFHVLYCITTMALGRLKVCFFRQFVWSVPKVDYLTLRHGFIMAHLAPQSSTHFDFQKYIMRSLDEDLKIILLVGTKLQVVITRMALQIMERGDVVKGVPVVQPTDDHFWFNNPKLILYLIHFVLFQNAFQLAFFVWSVYEFGLNSCFHEHNADIAIRISMG
ncbi:hypothetical protein Taro_041363 [Colocasia esculenta]|uniref:MLO-like protein n=1 Tax=Colocasia esculenta TaxID=4460 RepID=A0A843WVN7_COLES|nr:hypothetical protein [Colocasia esculenta]